MAASLWMVFAAASFACMNVLVKVGAQDFSAMEMVFYRSLVTLVLSFALLQAKGSGVRTGHYRFHFQRGVAGVVSLVMYYYGIVLLPLANAVTLNYTSPLFLTLLVLALAHERLHWPFALAIAGGFVGTALLLQPTFSADMWFGGLVALGSGMVSALAYYNVRELVQLREPETRVVFYFSLHAVAVTGVWLLLRGVHELTWKSTMTLLGIGISATAGQLAMTTAYGKGKTLLTGALSYSTVVFSTLLGIAMFGDVLPAWSWVGIACIIGSGVLAIQFAPGKSAAAEE